MQINRAQFIGAIFTIIIGGMLHFTFSWSGRSQFVGIFSAVNESTWEHLKLLFTPMLVFGIIEYFIYGRKIANFVPVRAFSILIGMIVIVASFYTYVGIVGQHFLWADIATFVFGAATAYFFSARYLDTAVLTSTVAIVIGWSLLLILSFSFYFFTFCPPKIGLFLDVQYNRYGIW